MVDQVIKFKYLAVNLSSENNIEDASIGAVMKYNTGTTVKTGTKKVLREKWNENVED